jgi:hypothetical protein
MGREAARRLIVGDGDQCSGDVACDGIVVEVCRERRDFFGRDFRRLSLTEPKTSQRQQQQRHTTMRYMMLTSRTTHPNNAEKRTCYTMVDSVSSILLSISQKFVLPLVRNRSPQT